MSRQRQRSGREALDATTGILRCSVAQAALELGISEHAVGASIEAGSLLAIRQGQSWVVIIDVPMNRLDTSSSTLPKLDEFEHQQAASLQPSTNAAGTDVTALSELVEQLAERNEVLSEEIAGWQMRARRAEEQLQTLDIQPLVLEPAGSDHELDSEPLPMPASSSGGGIGRRSANLLPLHRAVNGASPSSSEADTTLERGVIGPNAAPEPGGERSRAVRSILRRLGGWVRRR